VEPSIRYAGREISWILTLHCKKYLGALRPFLAVGHRRASWRLAPRPQDGPETPPPTHHHAKPRRDTKLVCFGPRRRRAAGGLLTKPQRFKLGSCWPVSHATYPLTPRPTCLVHATKDEALNTAQSWNTGKGDSVSWFWGNNSSFQSWFVGRSPQPRLWNRLRTIIVRELTRMAFDAIQI
jgi:hypothetical protein